MTFNMIQCEYGIHTYKKEAPMPDRTVYSTESGRINICPTCEQPYKHCHCDQPSTLVKKSDGIVRVMRDRKQRGGKTVTVISGVQGDDATITALAQQLK